MREQELKLIFKENLAFLTEEVALDFTQVDLPDSSVKFKAPAFWTIRVINYIENEKRLFVEILDYQVGDTQFPYHQIQLADTLMEVEKVDFKSIDTPSFFKTLNGTQPIKILPPKPEIVYRGEAPPQSETRIRVEPIIQTYSEPFSIPIKDVTFLNGSVVFEKKIQQFIKSVEFQIFNDNIIEQYDAVKNYLANVLNTKKIQVVPTITTENGKISSVKAVSNEIEKIDRTFFKEVKSEFIRVTKRKELPGDKQLFTIEEYFEAFVDEAPKSQQLFKDENDFFDTLIENSETKHYKQLRFLSSKHKHDLQKLRFVQNPFSFVFLLNGINNFYFVWETLDTEEATYIWTVDNNIENLERVCIYIDKTINHIMRDGKNEFIKKNEKDFNRVLHDYKDAQNGFKNWKDSIEKIIL